MFNKRKLGQQKRRAKESVVDGATGCLGGLFSIAFKIAFYPFTLIYYGFIKKDVNKNWRLFYKICALIIWLFFTYIAIEVKLNEDNVVNTEVVEEEKKEIKKEVKKPAPKIKKKVVSTPTLDYTVLPIKRVGLKSQNRAVQKIIVSSDSLPTKESLEQTAIKHWKDNSYSKYEELTIFIYLLEMNTNDTAYCVVEFDKKGKINVFSINEYSTLGTKWD